MGATVHEDVDGVAPADVPGRDLRYYLDLTCGQLRRFGQSEPSVLAAMLRMLRDVGHASDCEAQRPEIRRAAQMVIDQATGICDADMALLRHVAEQVELALCGASGAFDDRAGETRSL